MNRKVVPSFSNPVHQPARLPLFFLASLIASLQNSLKLSSSFIEAFSSPSSWTRPTDHSCQQWRPTTITTATHHHHHHPRSSVGKLDLSPKNIIDAEVISPDDDDDVNNVKSTESSLNDLIEYSQNLDPAWKTMPIAFCDAQSNTYIDCNLAFYVRDPTTPSILGENVEEYALGVPCEIPIVVAIEIDDDSTIVADATKVVNLSRVIPINPDDNNYSESGLHNNNNDNNIIIMQDEEKEEIFQLAARALMDEFGPSIRLKRTPRVLTMEGNLDDVLGGDWRRVLWGGASQRERERNRKGTDDDGDDDDDDKTSLENMLHEYTDDEEGVKKDIGDEDFFDTIMKRDLGNDYESLVDDDDNDIDEDLLKLFDDSAEIFDDDLDELMDKVKEIKTEIDEADGEESSYDALLRKLQPSAALRLLNFLGPDGREYTILRPLRPILLVGKEDPEDYTRRILLSEEERAKILPRLESACREGLEDILSGYNLSG